MTPFAAPELVERRTVPVNRNKSGTSRVSVARVTFVARVVILL